MDNHQQKELIERAVIALETLAREIERLNKEGVVVFGGTTMEEN